MQLQARRAWSVAPPRPSHLISSHSPCSKNNSPTAPARRRTHRHSARAPIPRSLLPFLHPASRSPAHRRSGSGASRRKYGAVLWGWRMARLCTPSRQRLPDVGELAAHASHDVRGEWWPRRQRASASGSGLVRAGTEAEASTWSVRMAGHGAVATWPMHDWRVATHPHLFR